MNFALYIARKLSLKQISDDHSNSQRTSRSLVFATCGVTLAIIVMILSIVIICGFKNEVTSKIYALDAHIRVNNAAVGIDENYSTISRSQAEPILNSPNFKGKISAMSLIAEKSIVLKTDNDFAGTVLKGVDANYNWQFFEKDLVEGSVPNPKKHNEIIISQQLARKLQLKAGDSILAYFIDQAVKMRKLTIAGIFNTDFHDFDVTFILGNIGLIQEVNGWAADTGHYLDISAADINTLPQLSSDIFSALAVYSYQNKDVSTVYNVTNTHRNNLSYFVWLQLLDMNVVIILIIMAIVSAFTLVAAMLTIILQRIRMIGQLKAMGATNLTIQRIFIFLTNKLIIKAIILGNVLAIGFALLQQHFHIIKLDPANYYMPFVPIHIVPAHIIILNVAIIAIAYITLLAPSYIIAKISPTSSLRYE